MGTSVHTHGAAGAGDCAGCGGGCMGEVPGGCQGPAHVPWLPHDRCMSFFESRIFGDERLHVRITYEHCLKLKGRQQGPLLYSTTLIPGEEVRLYEFDRYRRTRAETQRLSVHASFRQTVSALSQNRRSSSTSSYANTLLETRSASDSSLSVGGGLAGFFGAPSGSTDRSSSTESRFATGATASATAETFSQFAVTASQAVEAERSIVVSTFEDAEHRESTQRVLKNENPCYAVTYFVRRVLEVYQLVTRVVLIEWRLGTQGEWRRLDDTGDLSASLKKAIETILKGGPKIGQEARDAREITVPTDGTLYEAELAHCSSCDPMREAQLNVELEAARVAARRKCLEAELLALEVERRRGLLAAGTGVELGVEPLSLGASLSITGNPA
jgi:hypothetical protein